MYALMPLESILLTEWLFTYITTKRLLPTMYVLMPLQIFLLTEWLLHTSQQNSCAPLCVRWCAFRTTCWLNNSPLSSHEYCRSSPCTGWRSFKLSWKLRVNNMKNTNMKRNKFEAPVQWDVKSVGVRVVTERAHPLVWCVPVSMSMYGDFWFNRS